MSGNDTQSRVRSSHDVCRGVDSAESQVWCRGLIGHPESAADLLERMLLEGWWCCRGYVVECQQWRALKSRVQVFLAAAVAP